MAPGAARAMQPAGRWQDAAGRTEATYVGQWGRLRGCVPDSWIPDFRVRFRDLSASSAPPPIRRCDPGVTAVPSCTASAVIPRFADRDEKIGPRGAEVVTVARNSV